MKAKKYILNFSSQFVMNLVSQAIGIFTLPYAARMLGPGKFGEFNLVLSISGYVTILATFGFLQYASRELPRMDDVRPLVNAVRTLRLLLGFLSLGVMVVLGMVLDYSDDFLVLSIIAGANIVLGAFDMRNVFTARDQMWRVSYLGILGSLAYAVALYLMVDSPDDIVAYGICWMINVIVPVGVSLYLYARHFGGMKLTLKYDKWDELKRESVPLGLSSITGTINAYFAGVIIGFYLTAADLGYYSAGLRLVLLFTTLFNLVGAVVTPTISRLYVKDRAKLLRFLQMYFLVALLLGLSSAVALWLLSGWVVGTLFGAEYARSTELVRIWALFLLPLTPMSIFFTGSLIPCNGSRDYFLASLAGAVATLVSIPALLYALGLPGAPFASVAAELTVASLGAYFLRRRLGLSAGEMRSLFNLKQAFEQVLAVMRGKEASALEG